MGAASAWVRSAPRITRHLAFVIPAAAERRSPPDAAGRGAFGHIIGEPTTDHAARCYKFESISLQGRVCELSVTERELAPRSPPSGTAVRTGRRLRGPRSSRDTERCPTIFRTALCGPEKLS